MKTYLLAAAALSLGLSSIALASPSRNTVMVAEAAPTTVRSSGTDWSEPGRGPSTSKPATALYDPADDLPPSRSRSRVSSEPLESDVKSAPVTSTTVVDEPPPPPSRSKPAGYRTAKYSGGEGSTWKTGRDSHGFMGTFGGCRYSGFAGPNGYKINRSC